MNILIIGATSSIARPIAAAFAAKGDSLYLASRDESELKKIAQDIKVRFNTPTQIGVIDLENLASHEAFFQTVLHEMKTIDGIVIASGYLGKPEHSTQLSECKKILDCNFTGCVNFLNNTIDYFKQQKKGFIIGLGSVAGDRGRKSNLIYGAAKAGFTTYLQGLRNLLAPFDVRVITVKPGFVDTAMTFDLIESLLIANPVYVGKKIVASLEGSRDVIYVPWFWRYIMLIIKCIPESIFKRMSI